jgi:tetratricopeptide (TPR) repeat protein
MKHRKDQRTTSSPAPPSRESRRDLLLAVLLFAGTLLVYAQVWGFGFVTVDDSLYVTGNPYVQAGLTPRSLIWSFTNFDDSNWIPLTWLSLMLDTDLYGVRPGGYHLTNVLLHAANAVLLFLALARATRNGPRSAFVAALFALHPLHVESVAWVAERKDVLSTLFGLLSLLAYVRYATGAGRRNLAASLLFFVGSLLSKQTLVTLPFVFLLLDFWPLGRLSLDKNLSLQPAKPSRSVRGVGPIAPKRDDRDFSGEHRSALRLVVEKVPFFAASVAFSAIILLAQTHGGAVMAIKGFSFAARCMNAVFVYAAYLRKTLFPQDLAVYYPHPHENISWFVIALAAALLLAITAAAIICIRRFPFLFVGWFWYLGTLVPMIGLVQIGSQQMADRYTYFPLIGVFLAVTWLVPELVPAGVLRARVLPAAALASVVLLAATTFSQISYWHDSVTLLRHSMECTPDNSVAHEFLGSAYISEGALSEGVEELEKAIRLAPAYAPLHSDLGSALQQLGRLDEAAAQYRESLALEERSPEVHTNLGLILFKRRQFEDAKAHYRRAIEIDPNFVPAHIDLAALCLETDDYAGAIAQSERALQLNRGLMASQVCIALALRGQGRLDEAIQRLRHLVEIAHDDPLPRVELARTLAMKQNASTH